MKKIIYIICSCIFLCTNFLIISYADPNVLGNKKSVNSGPGVNISNTTSTETKKENTSPDIVHNSVQVQDIDPNLNIENVIGTSNILELGNTNLTNDPILGQAQWLYYAFFNTNNNLITGTQTNLNTFLFNKDGFNRIYIDHNGIGRYYVRTYSVENGWSPWINSSEKNEVKNPNAKVQAIQFRIKGYIAKRADIYYKTILNDGTVLDWAKNGETSGSIGTGRYIVALKVVLWNKDIPFTAKTTTLTQSTFYDGPYIDKNGNVAYSTANAQPYTGWTYINEGQYYFINGQLAKGWHYIDGYKLYFNEDGSLSNDLEPIMPKTGKYEINYNKATRTMYVMAQDGNKGFIIPYKTFMTTNGPDTPLGTFKTYANYRWKIMHDNIYCQFLTRFKGPFLIHSLIYNDAPDSHHLDSRSYNNMDTTASDGCVRLQAKDAAWIYNNIPLGTQIHIYSDANNKGPVEKPAINAPIPNEQDYDPTDPVIK